MVQDYKGQCENISKLKPVVLWILTIVINLVIAVNHSTAKVVIASTAEYTVYTNT